MNHANIRRMRTCTAALLASFSVILASCGAGAPSAGAGKDAAAETGGSGGASGSGTAGEASDVSTTGAAGSAVSDGAAGNDGATDAADASSASRSAGCGKTPATGDLASMLVAHTVTVAGLADVYEKGGMFAQTSGSFDFSNRPYAVRLPATYDPTKAYSITFEGSGCGFEASLFAATPMSNFVIDRTHAGIEVALSYVTSCFADGGPIIGNRTDSPEVPYFRSVLADVEARFCVDETRVFVAGESSGAWEAQLLGCAAADVVRGISTFGGGLRDGRPACKGPVAAFLVSSADNPSDPLGPLPADDPWRVANGSPGFLPERDEILQRNGCVGTSTAPWNADFPACLRFTGCPAAAPVVWCPLLGQSRETDLVDTAYAPGAMWPFLSTLL